MFGIWGSRLVGMNRGIQPAMSLNFLREYADSRLTTSGGANGTRVNSSGVIVAATTPRFDYDPVTLAAKGLLVEEARTNRALWSGDPSNAAFSKTNIFAVTADGAVTRVDGTTGAFKVIPSTSAAVHYLDQLDAGLPDSTTISAQARVRKGDYDRARVTFIVKNGSGPSLEYQFSTETITLQSAGTGQSGVVFSVTEEAGGWCLFKIENFSTLTGATTPRARLWVVDDAGVTMTAGDEVKGTYWDTVQWEVGSSATSETPTTTASVARTADSAAMTGADYSGWAGSVGAYVVEFDVSSVTGTRPILSLDDNTANQQIRLYTSGTSLKLTVTDGGVTQADLTLGTVAANTTYRAAFRFAANDFAAVLSGGTVQTDAAGTVPVVDRMRIGSDQAGNVQNGHARYVRAYSTLPNATLQALTA